MVMRGGPLSGSQGTSETSKGATDPDFPRFKRQIRDKTGLDLEAYKSQQLERRILAMMRQGNHANLAQFYRHLETSPEAMRLFLDKLTINVSDFFRNPERWRELESTILPAILKANPRPKIWSAGCSIGAEIYSLAMLLAESDRLQSAQLVATDIDEAALAQAKTGIFSDYDVKGVDPARRKRFFTPEPDGRHRISDQLRRSVSYRKLDLLKDRYESRCDLIFCRNVVIYFTEETKREIYDRFYQSLNSGGILFVGGTERIMAYREAGWNMIAPFFYQKP